jgi:hypothetical protein
MQIIRWIYKRKVKKTNLYEREREREREREEITCLRSDDEGY